MIKKLRIKFVVVAILSVFVTLSILMTTINVMNYLKVIRDADQILYMLKENEGAFPEYTRQAVGNERNYFSKETPFESRYFSVEIDEDGDFRYIDTNQIEAIDSMTARKYAKQIYKQSRHNGFYSNYRYLVYNGSGGSTVILFLDCMKGLANFHYFLYASVWISLIGLVIVSFLITIVSGRIMKPVLESYEKQKRFITDAGHEIKTPLATINADVTVLEMEGLETNEWIADIKHQTGRLTTLTNDLITLSRMEEPDTEIEMIAFPISEVVLECAKSFEARARMEHKKYTIQIIPDLSYTGDTKSIKHLVSILLDNAFKYSPEDGTIRISLHKHGKGLELVVYNTATNIKKENISHLFDRFYRLESSRNSQTGGYGIGLSIAHAIVDKHRGKITAGTSDEKSLRIVVEL